MSTMEIDTAVYADRPLRRLLGKFRINDDGATAIEYGLIAALIAVSIIASVTAVASNISKTFKDSEVKIEATRD